MSNASDGSDFATFVRMYKQWGESRNQRVEGDPPPLTRSQHPTTQIQRPVAQRLSPPRSRPQLYRQPPLRNPADSILLQALDDVRKRQDEIYASFNALQTVVDEIKTTLREAVGTMVGTMERFEVVGRSVLELAVQPSNSHPSNSQPSSGAPSQPQPSNFPQPSQHTSQPPIFPNSQKPYQGPNITQPPAPFMASSNSTQPLYAPPASQGPEPYSDSYIDSNGFEFEAF